MTSGVCSHCGCTEIDKDQARGDAVCTGCGSVLEDQIIVSEVQFQENSAGTSSVIGQYVSSEGFTSNNNIGGAFPHGFGKESRAITLLQGKRKIQALGEQLHLNQHCIDTAYNFFKMAVSRRLTRGRKSAYSIAACLYIVCRTEGTPHMLLDFADILQVNVYTLGRAYLVFSHELCINIPALDPCLYIHRFAQQLELGERTHEVSMTALRLVSRMKRDWMAQGRRPSGLCGAALLVASRIHDFNRTIKQLIKIVRIGEATIRKRLYEFEQTPTSQLTIDEFQRIDLEEEMDPPCFTEGRRKAKLQLLEDQADFPKLTHEVSHLQKEIEGALDEVLLRKGKKSKLSVDNDDSSSMCSSISSHHDFDDEKENRKSLLDGSDMEDMKDDTNDEDCNLMYSERDKSIYEMEEKDPYVEMLEKEELEAILTSTHCTNLGPRPTAASLGLKETIERCVTTVEKESDEKEDGELDLEGIDDEELEGYILNAEEAEMKKRIWMDHNADYLKELEEKLAKQAELLKLQGDNPVKKKRTRKKNSKVEANSAGEAIEKMLQEKKISSKINYEVLKNLNKDINEMSTPPHNSFMNMEAEIKFEKVISSQDNRRFRKSYFSNDDGPPLKTVKLNEIDENIKNIKEDISISKINSVPNNSLVSKKHKLKYELNPIEPENIVVESGPVVYDVEAPKYEDDEEYDDEEDYKIESAAQLLGQGGDDDEYADFDDYY